MIYVFTLLKQFLYYVVSVYVNNLSITLHQNNAMTQLLAQVTEVENLYKQVHKRRSQPQINNEDGSVDKAY